MPSGTNWSPYITKKRRMVFRLADKWLKKFLPETNKEKGSLWLSYKPEATPDRKAALLQGGKIRRMCFRKKEEDEV